MSRTKRLFIYAGKPHHQQAFTAAGAEDRQRVSPRNPARADPEARPEPVFVLAPSLEGGAS